MGSFRIDLMLESSATLVLERNPRIKRIVNSPDMFPNITGVVVLALGQLLNSRPEVAKRFVGLFRQATERTRAEPAKVAPVPTALGGDLVAEATIANAPVSPAVSFVNDPAEFRQATEALLAYQVARRFPSSTGAGRLCMTVDGSSNRALSILK